MSSDLGIKITKLYTNFLGNCSFLKYNFYGRFLKFSHPQLTRVETQ